MTNLEIAAAFTELADRLALTDIKPFRYMAYRTAAKRFSVMGESVAMLAQRGELTRLEGIGPAIEQKVLDLLETGTFPALEDARAEVADGLLELTKVEGVGAKTARALWSAVDGDTGGPTAIDDLFAAAEAGTMPAVPGVGPKVQKALATHAAARRSGTLVAKGANSGVPLDAAGQPLPGPWFTRAQVARTGDALAAVLEAALGRSVAIDHAGEYARGQEVARGAVLLVNADPLIPTDEVAAALEAAGWRVTAPGDPIEVVAPSGVPAGVVMVPGPSARRALIDALASPDGWAEHPAAHAAPPVPIELRERVLSGALDVADVPSDLVVESDLVGDLHTHSTWSDGDDTILDMARSARARGDRYIVVTDHSAPYALVNGLGRDRLLQQAEEIAAANEQLEIEANDGASPFRVYQGSEVEILATGELGLDDDTLELLDWVVASLHTAQHLSAAQQRERMERVLANPLVDQIGHPTSRVVLTRDRTALDVEWLIARAAEEDVVLEINANPRRLDLDSTHAAAASAAGVRLAINTDAHSTGDLANRRHGVAVARRAGATATGVVNCLDFATIAASRRRTRTAGRT